MKIFDKMMDIRVRQEFLQYKEEAISCDEKDIEGMKHYIFTEQCTLDIQRLEKGDYFLGPPLQKERKKGCGTRKRLVYSFESEESYLLRMMAFILHDYDDIFSDNLYSFRKKKKVATLVNLLKNTEHIEEMYILKTDVRNFGDSIDGEILTKQVREIFSEDVSFLRFLEWLLSWHTYRKNGEIRYDGPAVMSGMPLANFLENIYLMELDAFFEKNHILYGRYADDIVIYTDTEEEILECQKILLEEMKNKKLELHMEKSMILPPGSPVEVLGMKLTGVKVDISDSAIKKLKWKLRKSADRLMKRKKYRGLSDEDAMKLMIIYAKIQFFGGKNIKHEMNWCRMAFPLITEIEGLQKIDNIIQNNVRYVGSGKKSNARYRIRYKKIKELGYQSLVNLYYKRYEIDWSEM